MKVSVCKACTCQLELLLEKKDSCLIVFCGKLVYSVFTAFFRFGKKTESWESFHVEDALTGALVSAGFVSDQKLQIEDLKPGLKIEDWRSRKTSSIQSPGLKIEDWRSRRTSSIKSPGLKIEDWRSRKTSSIQSPGLKIEGTEELLQSRVLDCWIEDWRLKVQKNFFNQESWIEDWRLKIQKNFFNQESWIEDWRLKVQKNFFNQTFLMDSIIFFSITPTHRTSDGIQADKHLALFGLRCEIDMHSISSRQGLMETIITIIIIIYHYYNARTDMGMSTIEDSSCQHGQKSKAVDGSDRMLWAPGFICIVHKFVALSNHNWLVVWNHRLGRIITID